VKYRIVAEIEPAVPEIMGMRASLKAGAKFVLDPQPTMPEYFFRGTITECTPIMTAEDVIDEIEKLLHPETVAAKIISRYRSQEKRDA
jgi:hypothetical protein